jgi:hypothetical protein
MTFMFNLSCNSGAWRLTRQIIADNFSLTVTCMPVYAAGWINYSCMHWRAQREFRYGQFYSRFKPLPKRNALFLMKIGEY